MDGKKHLVPGWSDALKQLREQGRDMEASEIEEALREGRRIQAVQLLRRCGIQPPKTP